MRRWQEIPSLFPQPVGLYHSASASRLALVMQTRPCLLALALLGLLAVMAPQPSKAAPAPANKLDKVDVEMVLRNQRLFDNYVKCVMDKAPCSAEGAELKERLPKELATKCKDCSENEKARAKKVIEHLKTKRPDVWEAFKKKYDPENQWQEVEWVN